MRGRADTPPLVHRHAAPLQIITRPPSIVRTADLAAAATPDPGVTAAVVLLLVLPLFGQTFHYMSHWPAVYYLSKAWPIIVLPLTLRGMALEQAPLRWLFLLILAYTVGLTPLMAMIHFDSPFLDALATTNKVWPFSYYFAVLCLMVWLRPTAATLRHCVVALGGVTFVLMAMLWLIAPADWYSADAVNKKFLLYEFERGYRIYMPMYFGALLLFYLARRFAQDMDWRLAILIAVGFLLLVTIYKQRMTIAAATVTVLLAACPPRWRRIAAAAAMAGAVVGIAAVILSPVLQWAVASLGNSLLVRLDSLSSAVRFIDDDAIDWAFGLGTVTRFSKVTLSDILGNDMFFLADIGWLGVVFEYGVVGALLMAAGNAAAWIVARRNGERTGDPFARALGDYIVFAMLTSLVYAPTLLTGEVPTALALSVYLVLRASPASRPGR